MNREIGPKNSKLINRTRIELVVYTISTAFVLRFQAVFHDFAATWLFRQFYGRQTQMTIPILKSKIHRAKVTEANIDYIGSVSIDEDLMDAANLIENEQVHVLNYRNGDRIITYAIKGERGSGIICLNGQAALKFMVDDQVIVLSYCMMDFKEARSFKPVVIFPDSQKNRLH